MTAGAGSGRRAFYESLRLVSPLERLGIAMTFTSHAGHSLLFTSPESIFSLIT